MGKLSDKVKAPPSEEVLEPATTTRYFSTMEESTLLMGLSMM